MSAVGTVPIHQRGRDRRAGSGGARAAGAPVLRVSGLCASYGSTATRKVVVDDVTFEVAAGKAFVLLGSSGCGKTTTLRAVAGLHRPHAGSVEIGGETVFSGERRVNVPPNGRSVSMVFQSYALWPHMTALQNVMFPLRSRRPRWTRSAATVEAEGMLADVGLADQAGAYPWALSGGQQQRVALARALVGRPSLVLLDEPLSNLDATLRSDLRRQLRRILTEHGSTSVYVTHDQAEALALADEIAVMSGGRIVERGSPRELYRRPATQVGGSGVGRANLVRATVGDRTPEGFEADSAWGRLRGSSGTGPAPATGAAVLLLFRPEDGRIVSPPERPAEGECRLEGRCRSAVFLGDVVEYELEAGTESVIVRVPCDGPTVEIGQLVVLVVRGPLRMVR